MSMASTCNCGAYYFCTGICKKPVVPGNPEIIERMYTQSEVDELNRGWLLTLKVMRTIMEKAGLSLGAKKASELIEMLEAQQPETKQTLTALDIELLEALKGLIYGIRVNMHFESKEEQHKYNEALRRAKNVIAMASAINANIPNWGGPLSSNLQPTKNPKP